MAASTDSLLALATSLGAAGAGVCTADPFHPERTRILQAVATGRSGPLHFTYDDPVTATDVRSSFPWAERIVVLAVAYLADSPPAHPRGAFVARFATADHYARLRASCERIADELLASGHRAEVLIDDNRLVDRAAAVRAGVGWWGRSTMVLAPLHGPWLLLGAVVTDADLATTEPMIRDCGTCTACIPACPTGALSEAAGLDARRCLAAWLQAPGPLPHWLRPHIGTRIYGCDDCLTSCPPGFRSAGNGPEPGAWPIPELLDLDDEGLVAQAPWWYVPRREGRFLRRNLLVAAGNGGNQILAPVVEAHLDHPSSLIRGHAAWALARLRGPAARPALRARLAEETVQDVADEVSIALLAVEHPAAHAALLAADEWVSTTDSLLGLALMGSHAAAGGTFDSDLDLLVLTPRPDQVTPPADLGSAHRGLPLRLGRALGHHLRGPVPVDLVIGPLDWPTDPGGNDALAAGIVIVNDRQRLLDTIRRRHRTAQA